MQSAPASYRRLTRPGTDPLCIIYLHSGLMCFPRAFGRRSWAVYFSGKPFGLLWHFFQRGFRALASRTDARSGKLVMGSQLLYWKFDEFAHFVGANVEVSCSRNNKVMEPLLFERRGKSVAVGENNSRNSNFTFLQWQKVEVIARYWYNLAIRENRQDSGKKGDSLI